MGVPIDVRERNRILRNLSDADAGRVAASLERVTVKAGDIALEANAPITHVYFPETAIASIIHLMADGSGVEVLTAGREGMIGSEAFLGVETSPSRVMWQIGGQALRMSTAAFRAEVARQPAMRAILVGYSRVIMVEMTQGIACNRLHGLEQRAARWLLMTRDRLDGDEFEITQEALAFLLGVTRPNVTLAARSLQQAGLIAYRRGHIRILDRTGLEAVSCECYAVVRQEFDRLAGPRASG